MLDNEIDDVPCLSGYKFAHAVSLGSQCYASAVFKRLGLKKYSCPFDWMFTTLSMVRECIESDFLEFLDQKYYSPVTRGGKIEHKHTFYQTYWGTNFTHYDPLTEDGHNYLKRCVNRFRLVLASPDPKLFLFLTQIHAHERNGYIKIFADLDAAIASRTRNASLIGVTITATGEEPGMAEATRSGTGRLLHYTAESPLQAIRFKNPADDARVDQFVLELMAV